MDFASGKKYARNIPLADRGRYRKFSSTDGGNTPTSSSSSSSSTSSLSVVDSSSTLVSSTPIATDTIIPNGLAAAVMEAHQEEVESRTGNSAADAYSSNNNIDGDNTLESPIDPRITELDLDPASSRMATILLGLPEPEIEVEQALSRSMSREEVQALLKKVWDRRQEVLKDAFAHAKTEGSQMQDLLNQLIQPEQYNLTTEDMIDILESLEYFVATVHNAEDFHAIGGFNVIISLFNHSNILIRTPAAWIMGTAIKGHDGLQRAALDLGLAPSLMEMLHTSLDHLDSTKTVIDKSNNNDKIRVLALKAANKAIYALNGLVRYSSLAQSHILSVGGGSVLRRTLNIARQYASMSGTGTSNTTPVEKQARTLIGKIFTLLSDLVQDENDTNGRLSRLSGKEEVSTHSNIVRVKLHSEMDKYRTLNETLTTEKEDISASSSTSSSSSSPSKDHDGPTLTRVEKDTATGQRKVFNVITPEDAVDGTRTNVNGVEEEEATSTIHVEQKTVTLPLLNYIRNNKVNNQEFCNDMQSAVQTVQTVYTEEGSSDHEVKLLIETSSQILSHAFCGAPR